MRATALVHVLSANDVIGRGCRASNDVDFSLLLGMNQTMLNERSPHTVHSLSLVQDAK